jgi:uroporphyrinogen-III synthase
MKKQLFISKNFNEIQDLNDFCTQKDIEVIAHSFLQFEAIPFQINESYEAIFFGSPRAVDFFLSQEIIPENCIIGCIGEITANSLKAYGLESNFIGENSGDTSRIATEFKKLAGNKKVLFPQSSISNRSVSSVFEANQIIEISIYKTAIHSLSIPNSDIYVFTSPSNVDGFLVDNNILENSNVIAWGKTTENYLIEKKIKVNHVLKNANLNELIQLLNTL